MVADAVCTYVGCQPWASEHQPSVMGIFSAASLPREPQNASIRGSECQSSLSRRKAYLINVHPPRHVCLVCPALEVLSRNYEFSQWAAGVPLHSPRRSTTTDQPTALTCPFAFLPAMG